MAQIEYIKHLYEVEGKSLREIAKKTGFDFRTVQKYAYQNDWNPKVELSTKPEKFPVLGPYIPIIDAWLEQDSREPRKQRHTIMRIYKRLQTEHQFPGKYGSVKRYVVRKRIALQKEREGYLPLAQIAGHAQVDFGKFKYYDVSGKGKKGYALLMTFPHSNAGWMQVFPSENQECLLEGMKRIFYHVGGVPIRIRYDNMATAVAQIGKGHERLLTDGFYRFKIHHRFEAEFCNPSKGNEKGNVENKVGYDRRNMLVPVPTIEDFTVFNEDLLRRCDADHEREHYRHGKSIRELWEQEKEKLLTLPEHEYEVFRYESVTTSKTGFVQIDGQHYGISPALYGKSVQAKIYFDRIAFYHEHELLTTYTRSYESPGKEMMDWTQYLPTMLRKPGAVEHTRFFNQMPRLWQEHLKSIQGKERKSALSLLLEIVEEGNQSLCEDALELASEHGRTDSDSIRQCYYTISRREHHPPPLQLHSQPPVLDYRPDLSAYDSLTGGK